MKSKSTAAAPKMPRRKVRPAKTAAKRATAKISADATVTVAFKMPRRMADDLVALAKRRGERSRQALGVALFKRELSAERAERRV